MDASVVAVRDQRAGAGVALAGQRAEIIRLQVGLPGPVVGAREALGGAELDVRVVQVPLADCAGALVAGVFDHGAVHGQAW